MLPKFHVGNLITCLEKVDMFWLVLRILPDVKSHVNFSHHPSSNHLLYPYQYLASALTKAYVSDYVQPLPNFFSVCCKTFLEIHLTYTSALHILSDKKVPKQSNESFVLQACEVLKLNSKQCIMPSDRPLTT
jgi:hypothetical protein